MAREESLVQTMSDSFRRHQMTDVIRPNSEAWALAKRHLGRALRVVELEAGERMQPLVQTFVAARLDRTQLIDHELAALVAIVEQIAQQSVRGDGFVGARHHHREDVQLGNELYVERQREQLLEELLLALLAQQLRQRMSVGAIERF